MNKYTINDITRASGGFAMLAVDQREAMRMMFAAAGAPAPVADSVLTDFKVNAAKTLSPYGVVCGRGRNPTLRLWPAIFSGEIDVFPSERRNMGQEIGR